MSTASLRVRRVSYVAILCAPNAQRLIDEYAAECSIPDALPQVEMYAAMEKVGVLQCFGAYLNEALIGFASIVSGPMPHNGKRLATMESIFVSADHRSSGAGNALLAATEQHAAELGCVSIIYTVRLGSALQRVLLRRCDCVPTHTVYTRWL